MFAYPRVMVAAVRGLALTLALVALVIGLYRLGPRRRAGSARRRHPPTLGGLLGESLHIVGALVVLGVLATLLEYGGNLAPHTPAAPGFAEVAAAERATECGPTNRGLPVVVEVLHSDDKRRWIEHAADIYMRRCPNVQIRLIARGDLAAADALLRGESRPTVWAPIDELSLQYLEARWRERSSERPFVRGRSWSLAESPLVLLLWEDRLRALTTIRAAAGAPEGFWPDALCATVPRDPDLAGRLQRDMHPGRWLDWYQSRFPPLPPTPAPARRNRPRGGPAEPPTVDAPPVAPGVPDVAALHAWGRVKIESSTPTHDAAGLSTLYLMAYQYLHASELAAGADLAESLARRRDELRRWLRNCQAGLEVPRESVQRLTDDFISDGSDGLDAVVTYEHLVFSVFAQFGTLDMGEPRVLYPQPTLLARHPAVLLWPDDPERAIELAAAERWLEFLRSEEIQREAVAFGLRPAAFDASLGELDLATNPFLESRRFGVELEPLLREPPRADGRVVRELVTLWREATGRL